MLMSIEQTEIIIEKRPRGYVAYSLNLKCVIVEEGATREDSLADVKSAVKFHIESSGHEAFDNT